jgi:GT2 family glycosyltransferase
MRGTSTQVPDPDRRQLVNCTLPRNVLACTGACLMVSREKFEEVGGFNEALTICGDIDICARFHAGGC